MARGKTAEEGSTFVSQNGYHYTKRDGKFQLTHRLLAADQLGRPLRQGEQAIFRDGNKANLDPKNIEVRIVGGKKKSLQKRQSELEAKIEELQAELHDVNMALKAQTVS